MTKEDLDAIKYAFDQAIKPMRTEINTRFDSIDERLNKLEKDVKTIKKDLRELKYNTEVNRRAQNEVITWFDVYHRDSSTPFPVDRNTYMEMIEREKEELELMKESNVPPIGND